MITKESLLSIPELKLNEKDMTDDWLRVYSVTLNSFIEEFPLQEKALKAALAAKDYDSFFAAFASIWDSLKKIHADDLATEYFNQVNRIKNEMHEKIEDFMTFFLTLVSGLSIDIQMAQHKGKTSAVYMGDKTEKKSILAVDDTAFFLTTLKAMLQNSGYKLTCVTSGKQALSFLFSHNPDLFLLDIDMPEMNGYELAQKIRELGQKAPIIFLTGNSSREYVLKAIKMGASDFIIKPMNNTQALQKIAKFI